MLFVEESGLFAADLSQKINLFAGAGFSVLAKNGSGKYLPVGSELTELLVSEFGLHEYASLDLPSLYAIISSEHKEQLK